MKKDKKTIFVPKDAQEVMPVSEGEFSQQQIDEATAAVVQEENDKGLSIVQKLNVAWTVISTLYAIVSVCMFISKKWVESAYTYALIPMLAVFVIVFICLVVFTFKNPKKAQANIKNYKKALGIFKACVNIMFLALTAVSMAGLANGEMNLVKWIVFGATFFVAVVQLALKITKIVMKAMRKAVAKKFKVEVQKYVDGKKQKKTVTDKITEKSYKNN